MIKNIIIFILTISLGGSLWLAKPEIDMILDNNNTMILEGPAVNKQWKFAKDMADLIDYVDQLGYKVTLGEVWRTPQQQRWNIAHGFSWTMNSRHLKRRAVDLNLFINDKYITDCESYEPLGEYWESLGKDHTWGGSWINTKDCPHFELN